MFNKIQRVDKEIPLLARVLTIYF